MKYSFYSLLAISFLSPSIFLFSAEPMRKVVPIEVTAIIQPFCASFIDANTLFIGARTGGHLVKWRENIKDRTVFTDNCGSYCFPNTKKDKVIFSNQDSVTMYDLKGTKLWQIPGSLQSCVFTSDDIAWVIDQKTNTILNSNHQDHQLSGKTDFTYSIIAAHPRKKEFFYTHAHENASEIESKLYKVNLSHDGERICVDDEELPDPTKKNNIFNQPYVQACNQNGIIALYYPFSDSWSLYHRKDKKFIAENLCEGTCSLLAFHPVNSCVVAILTRDGFIKLYDMLTKSIVDITSTTLGSSHQVDSLSERLIDYSDDGNDLVVIIEKKCYVLSGLNTLPDNQ
jgi:hypothetical protein